MMKNIVEPNLNPEISEVVTKITTDNKYNDKGDILEIHKVIENDNEKIKEDTVYEYIDYNGNSNVSRYKYSEYKFQKNNVSFFNVLPICEINVNYNYDSSGRLQNVIDKDGNRIDFYYSEDDIKNNGIENLNDKVKQLVDSLSSLLPYFELSNISLLRKETNIENKTIYQYTINMSGEIKWRKIVSEDFNIDFYSIHDKLSQFTDNVDMYTSDIIKYFSNFRSDYTYFVMSIDDQKIDVDFHSMVYLDKVGTLSLYIDSNYNVLKSKFTIYLKSDSSALTLSFNDVGSNIFSMNMIYYPDEKFPEFYNQLELDCKRKDPKLNNKIQSYVNINKMATFSVEDHYIKVVEKIKGESGQINTNISYFIFDDNNRIIEIFRSNGCHVNRYYDNDGRLILEKTNKYKIDFVDILFNTNTSFQLFNYEGDNIVLRAIGNYFMLGNHSSVNRFNIIESDYDEEGRVISERINHGTKSERFQKYHNNMIKYKVIIKHTNRLCEFYRKKFQNNYK